MGRRFGSVGNVVGRINEVVFTIQYSSIKMPLAESGENAHALDSMPKNTTMYTYVYLKIGYSTLEHISQQ